MKIKDFMNILVNLKEETDLILIIFGRINLLEVWVFYFQTLKLEC
jgi:hypothetical protein